MSKIIIKKSKPLIGEISVSGSKNSVLPIMAAALLTKEECEITEVPVLRDVNVMCKLLKSVGSDVEGDFENDSVKIKAEKIKSKETPYELVKMMRASVLAMGPLLARTGSAKVPLPGGCAIGARPIDLHLKGFRALGAQVTVESGYVEAKARKLKGNTVYLDQPSVGATENILMAAVLASGDTVIENAAKEPEIVDLASFLNKMGAKIKGAGTDNIRIEGVKELHGAKHAVIPDRIETGTFMLAAAITRGNLLIKNSVPDHVKPIIAKLTECGVTVEDDIDGMRVNASKGKLKATDVKTLPYPGFPTDMQSQFMAFLSTVEGTSVVIETVFENRYQQIGELNRMGADIKIEGRSAVIEGGCQLRGAEVVSTDLRAGAALVLAGLAAKGETEISEIYHIERGYSNLIEKLSKVGADISKVESVD